MATTDIAREIHITAAWNAPSDETSYENVMIEVEDRLHDAPNVEDFWGIADSHLENTIGFAVNFTDGTQGFFLAFMEPTVVFDAEGNATIIK